MRSCSGRPPTRRHGRGGRQLCRLRRNQDAEFVDKNLTKHTPARRFARGRRSAAARLPACLRRGRVARRRFRFGRWRLRCWGCLPSLVWGRRPRRRWDCFRAGRRAPPAVRLARMPTRCLQRQTQTTGSCRLPARRRARWKRQRTRVCPRLPLC